MPQNPLNPPPPLLGLQKATGISDPYASMEMKQSIGPMPPLGGALKWLQGLTRFGSRAAQVAPGAKIANTMTPSPQEIKELFPKAQGILGDPIEQGKQAMYKRFWKLD